MNATFAAVQEFNDFARLWVPPAIREQVWEPRNNPVTSMVRAIKAIAPLAEPVGYGVFGRVYDYTKREGWEYVRASLVFEHPPTNALDYCRTKQPRDDFVICQLQELRDPRNR